MSKTAVILIAEGTEEIEAITPGDVLVRAGVDVTYASVGTETPIGAHHIPLRADCIVEDLEEILFDAVVIPGGSRGAEILSGNARVGEIIRHHYEAGKIVAAICASPAVVLAPLGILNGRHAVCYPGMERRFPRGVRHGAGNIALDGHVLTSRGPATSLEFSLKLVEILLGIDVAAKVGHGMLVPGL